MTSDTLVSVSFMIPLQNLQRVEKLSKEYGLSRGAMIERLVNLALKEHGEPITRTNVTRDIGEVNDNNIPISVHNEARKLL